MYPPCHLSAEGLRGHKIVTSVDFLIVCFFLGQIIGPRWEHFAVCRKHSNMNCFVAMSLGHTFNAQIDELIALFTSLLESYPFETKESLIW